MKRTTSESIRLRDPRDRAVSHQSSLGPARPLRPGPRLASWLVLLSVIACGGSEPPLPAIGEPAEAGDRLGWWQEVAMNRVLDYRVASGARAGFVALVARKGRIVYARTTGYADLESERPMRLDTRFHLASMTKPITAVAAMILIEEGRLSLDDPIERYLPNFSEVRVATNPLARRPDATRPLTETERIRVRHLLTFTSGIGGYAESEDPFDQAWRSPNIEVAGLGSLADRVALIPKLPLYEVPGETWRYGWSLDVLARVVEVAAGEPFDVFLERRIFSPLGMLATGYPDDVPPDEPLATMYTHDASGSLVPDPQFAAYYGIGWTPGGGGLVSTAEDFMRFALMLANGGILEGVRILQPDSLKEMTRLHVADGVLADMGIDGLGWGLGVSVVADASRTIMPAHDGDYWWSGRFGTQFWISPSEDTVSVVMQQTETGPYSDRPVTPSILQAIAMP